MQRLLRRACHAANLAREQGVALSPGLTWVRGDEADSRNFANISIVYKGQIRGVCLSRGGCRRRLLHQEDLLGH